MPTPSSLTLLTGLKLTPTLPPLIDPLPRTSSEGLGVESLMKPRNGPQRASGGLVGLGEPQKAYEAPGRLRRPGKAYEDLLEALQGFITQTPFLKKDDLRNTCSSTKEENLTFIKGEIYTRTNVT